MPKRERKVWKTLQVDTETYERVTEVSRWLDRPVNWVARKLLEEAVGRLYCANDGEALSREMADTMGLR